MPRATCPACKSRVVPMADGRCPACREMVAFSGRQPPADESVEAHSEEETPPPEGAPETSSSEDTALPAEPRSEDDHAVSSSGADSHGAPEDIQVPRVFRFLAGLSRRHKLLIAFYVLAVALPPLGALVGLTLFFLRRLKPHGVLLALAATCAIAAYILGYQYWFATADASTETLLHRLRHHLNRQVRKESAEALGNRPGLQGNRRVIEGLVDALEDVPAPAARALGKLGTARETPALIAAVHSDPTCTAAIRALGEIGDDRAIDTLVALLSHDARSTRKAAAEALEKIDPQWQQSDAPLAALPGLLEQLTHNDEGQRRAAAFALARLGGARADEALIAALQRRDLAVVAEAHDYYIRRGEPGTEKVLVAALEAHGGLGMAQAFLESGNGRLEKAGRRWARQNDVSIIEMPIPASGPQWGSDQ